MKVAIMKVYESVNSYYDGYDYEDVRHNFRAIEEVREMSGDDFAVLKKAVNYFNSNKRRDYFISLAVLVDDEEYDSLISDYKSYEKKALEKLEKERAKREAEELARKAKLDAKKEDRKVKKLAKELNVSEDVVRKMLENK